MANGPAFQMGTNAAGGVIRWWQNHTTLDSMHTATETATAIRMATGLRYTPVTMPPRPIGCGGASSTLPHVSPRS